MVLPIYITEHWLSASLVEAEPFRVVKTVFVRFPFTPSRFDDPLTIKQIHKLLLKTDLKFDTQEHRAIYICGSKQINDIEADILVDDFKKKYHFVPIKIDHYNSLPIETTFLNPEKLNQYTNCVHYKLDIPQETKFALDLNLFKRQVTDKANELIDTETIVVMTYDIAPENKEKYIEELIQTFSSNTKIAGIWAFSLDTSFSLIPMLGAIKFLKLDVKDVLEKDSLRIDAKLIIAPGVEEIEILKTKSKKYNSKKLKLETFNHITLSEKESIKIQWKTKGSKFSGEIYGSTSGILIDNRQIYKKM